MPTLVSAHFSVQEFDQPARHGQPWIAYPPEWVADKLRPLALLCEAVRFELGGVPLEVISGYRSPAYNRQIGGAKNSQHMQGMAADLKSKHATPEQVHAAALKVAAAHAVHIGGLGSYPTFTHVDIRAGARLARWSGGRTNS